MGFDGLNLLDLFIPAWSASVPAKSYEDSVCHPSDRVLNMSIPLSAEGID